MNWRSSRLPSHLASQSSKWLPASPSRAAPASRYIGCRIAERQPVSCSRCTKGMNSISATYANAQSTAVKSSMRSVIWPEARRSCDTTITTAGEVAVPTAAAQAASSGGYSKYVRPA